MDAVRNCKRCDGSGSIKYFGDKYSACHYCDGRGTFDAPDLNDMLMRLTKPGKDGRRAWRASRPKHGTTVLDDRLYYVWRIARFHGGKDVTLPMMASLDVAGDPFEPELDALASAIALRVFGSDMRGAARWHYALTGKVTSGYVDGPTFDEHKPADELLETK